MGFFEGLNAESYDRQYSDRQLLRRIGEYFKPQGGRLAGVMLLVIALGALFAAFPVFIGRLVDLLGTQPSLELIGAAGMVLVVIAFLQWGMNWARRSLVARAVGDVILQLRARAFQAAEFAQSQHDGFFPLVGYSQGEQQVNTDQQGDY